MSGGAVTTGNALRDSPRWLRKVLYGAAPVPKSPRWLRPSHVRGGAGFHRTMMQSQAGLGSIYCHPQPFPGSIQHASLLRNTAQVVAFPSPIIALTTLLLVAVLVLTVWMFDEARHLP